MLMKKYLFEYRDIEIKAALTVDATTTWTAGTMLISAASVQVIFKGATTVSVAGGSYISTFCIVYGYLTFVHKLYCRKCSDYQYGNNELLHQRPNFRSCRNRF